MVILNKMKKYLLFISLVFSFALSAIGQCIDEIGFYNRNGTFGITSIDQSMILSTGEIIDNSDPVNPTLSAQFSFSGGGSTVITDGDFAYFGTGMTNDLYIADISIISFPIAKGSIDFGIGNGVFGMGVQNETLFAALGGDGVLCSIDVSDKSNPQTLDTIYFSGGQCRDVAINGNYAFAAAGGGLKIIDITDPSIMDFITSIGSGYNSITLGDNYAFMGKSTGGVDVFDISDAANPSPAFSITNQFGTAWDLTYKDNLLYVATDFGGLFIYKIEENMAEEMATFHRDGNGQSFGVCLQDSLILLPGLVEGVSILQYDSTGFVGIHSSFEKKELAIFPNPANNFIDVSSYNFDLISEIEIFNMEGKLVYTETINETKHRIYISKLKPGEYILKVKTENKTLTKKFIKIE